MTSLTASFSAWFLKKNISYVYYITLPKSIVWLPLLREILGNVCFNCSLIRPGRDIINFEIKFFFLLKPFFVHDQKVKTKTWIFYERKELSLKQIKQFFGRWVSDVATWPIFRMDKKAPSLKPVTHILQWWNLAHL